MSSSFSQPISKERAVAHHAPIEAYDYAIEFMSEQELDEIIADPDDVRMQALLIRERILGPTHPDTTYYIRYRGAVYADCGNFRKCILLWLYALDTQQKSLDPLHPMIQSSFLSFTELFQYMQKQLAPFNGGGGRDLVQGGGGGLGVVDAAMIALAGPNQAALLANGPLAAEPAEFNMVHMYTATVLKILQQAVEEVKRGIRLLKQYQKNNGGSLLLASELSHHQKIPSDFGINGGISQLETATVATRLNETTNETENECNNNNTNKSANDQQTNVVVVVASPHQLTPTTPITTTSQITFDMAHFDRTLVVIVHFLIVVAESLKHCSPEETYKLKKLVYELIKLNPTNSKQSTLLHLASSRDSSAIIKNHTLSSFPSCQVLKLLLECGADPNSLDGERNSPLHLAAANRHSSLTSASASSASHSLPVVNVNAAATAAVSSNQQQPIAVENHQNAAQNNIHPPPPTISLNCERDKLICLLLNAGTHLDACNVNNKTASDLYKGGKMYQVINPINYLTLQCLAAKVIQKNKIAYREHLTSKLANFVAMH